MTDLSALTGGPTRSSRPTGGQRARIVRPPTALDASLTVSLLSYTNDYEYEVPATNWISRGTALPIRGAVGVAVFDDHGDAWFLLGGGTDFPAGGGGDVSAEASASTLAPGAAATVAVTEPTADHFAFAFGIPQGATGATGAAGTAGAPGSVWRSGAGAPGGALGVVGDWFLNTANGDVYEKTGASAWTLRDNLTGPTGPSGASTFLSGSGAPTAGVGVDGSIYLDVASLRLWGPKAAGAWPGTALARLVPLAPTYGQVQNG